MTAFQNYYCIN